MGPSQQKEQFSAAYLSAVVAVAGYNLYEPRVDEEVWKMTALANKGHILDEAGYAYGFDRMIYFNQKTRKVFSVEFVEDHNESELRKCIDEKTGGGVWHFNINSQPNESVTLALDDVLR